LSDVAYFEKTINSTTTQNSHLPMFGGETAKKTNIFFIYYVLRMNGFLAKIYLNIHCIVFPMY
jgi:hypothetical protein